MNCIRLLSSFILASLAIFVLALPSHPEQEIPINSPLWKCTRNIQNATKIIAEQILPELPAIVKCAGGVPIPVSAASDSVLTTYNYLTNLFNRNLACVTDTIIDTMDLLEVPIDYIIKFRC